MDQILFQSEPRTTLNFRAAGTCVSNTNRDLSSRKRTFHYRQFFLAKTVKTRAISDFLCEIVMNLMHECNIIFANIPQRIKTE